MNPAAPMTPTLRDSEIDAAAVIPDIMSIARNTTIGAIPFLTPLLISDNILNPTKLLGICRDLYINGLHLLFD